MNTGKVLIGCGVALVVGLLLLAMGLVVSTLLPRRAQPVIAGPAILVNINLPLNGAKLPLNEPVGVYAEAVGPTTIHDLELWVDGAFSPTKMDTSPVDRSPLNAVWLWKPAEQGVHRLIVRAIGPDGAPVNSNVVRVSVLPREQIAELQVPTLAPDQIPAATGSGESAALLFPEGEPVSGEPPPLPPTPPPQPEDPAPGPAGTPSLQVTIDGCDANLLIQDNSDDEDGFFLYRFDPTSTGFKNVATLDEHPGQGAFAYIDPGLEAGAHTYYVASYKGGVESAGNLVNLDVPLVQCKVPLAFGLQDALLTTTTAVDKVYCYLSVNGGPWERKPPGSNTFIYPSAGGFDLGDYLKNLISPPPPGGVTLELECWGWSGDTLIYLGYLKKEIGAGQFEIISNELSLIGSAVQLAVPETDLHSLSSAIPPPYNVRFASDADDCIAHTIPGLSSDQAATLCNKITKGFTVLTWHWFPGCWFPKPGEPCPYTVDDIEGYHIYELIPGYDPVQVNYVQVSDSHAAVIVPKTGGIIQPEYFVRAYKGNQESADSQHVFGATPKYSVSLTNPYMWSGTTYQRRYSDGCIGLSNKGPAYYEHALTSTDMWVGYKFDSTDLTFFCTDWYSGFYDGHVVFDLSPVQGKVTSAVLRWYDVGQSTAGSGAAGLSSGCWNTLVDQAGALIANYSLDGVNGHDVTTQVQAWVNGLPNNGFALWSGVRELAKAGNDRCLWVYSDFKLDVTYSPAGP